MWLRNWDNIQLIKMCGKVEDKNTTVFDDTSRTLKDYEGNIVTGNVASFFGAFDCALVNGYANGFLNTSLISSGNFLGHWDNSNTVEQFLTKKLNQRYQVHPSSEQKDLDMLNSRANYSGIGLFSGSGATEVNYNDYVLENENTALQASEVKNGPLAKDIENKKWKLPISRTFSNNTLENIQVSELGIYMLVGYGAAVNTNAHNYETSFLEKNCVLIYREVLPTPIILKPGDYQTFTIELSISTSG